MSGSYFSTTLLLPLMVPIDALESVDFQLRHIIPEGKKTNKKKRNGTKTRYIKRVTLLEVDNTKRIFAIQAIGAMVGGIRDPITATLSGARCSNITCTKRLHINEQAPFLFYLFPLHFAI